MAKWTIFVGAVLTIIGLLSATLADHSVTGLFPALLGIPVIALGALGRIHYDNRKRILMGALALAVIGFLITVSDVRFGLYLVSVGPVHVENHERVITHSFVALVCGAYLYGGIRWLLSLPRPQAASNL